MEALSHPLPPTESVTLAAEPLCSSLEPRTVTHKPLPNKVVPCAATNLPSQEGERGEKGKEQENRTRIQSQTSSNIFNPSQILCSTN